MPIGKTDIPHTAPSCLEGPAWRSFEGKPEGPSVLEMCLFLSVQPHFNGLLLGSVLLEYATCFDAPPVAG